MTQAFDNRHPKIPPPLVALIVGLLMLLWHRVAIAQAVLTLLPLPFGERVSQALAVAMTVGGLLVAILGIAAFRRAQTTVNPHRPHEASALVENGIYRYSRNPMYLGFVLLLIAWGLYLRDLPALIVGPGLLIIYLNRFQILHEERALLALFGQRYATYTKMTRRWC